MDSERDLDPGRRAFVSPEDLGMSGVVAGDVEEAIVLETYPHDKFQAAEEGRMTAEEFAEDLLRHVEAQIARRERRKQVHVGRARARRVARRPLFGTG
jgi:hypothetical protein